jgi:hemin uptake protein HemP
MRIGPVLPDRASIFMAAKLLQNTGDVVITHDGSSYA